MTDTQFMTAYEKEIVLKQWTTFVRGGFKQIHFTHSLYKHLTLHCSFIAHYNRAGFYYIYFENPENTQKFIGQFTTGTSVEYGADYWITDKEYSDINSAMVDVMKQHADKLLSTFCNAEKDRDISIAKSLLAKHGIELNT